MTDAQRVNYALGYSRHGARVFPCHHVTPAGQCSCGGAKCRDDIKGRGKHPLHQGWQTEATADRQALIMLWAANPLANIGIACGRGSNLTVVDIDGAVGFEHLRGLESKYGELPDTPRVITGSGGCHLLFQFEEGLTNAVRWAPGLDIRTEGGLIIGAGSRNAFGEYIFETGYSLKDLPRAKMPDWFIGCIKQGQGGTHSNGTSNGTGSRFKVPEQPIAEGEGRNSCLFRAGRSFKATGYSGDEIPAMLQIVNQKRCRPPVDEHEFKAILKSVMTQRDSADFKGAHSANANPDNQSSESSGDEQTESAQWPDPILLDMCVIDSMPTGIFTPAIQGMIDAVAAETETPPELGVGMAVATVAAAVQGKVAVCVKPGYIEPLSAWTLIVLPSGERKSAVHQRMTRPLVQWEAEQADRIRPARARALSERETLEAQVASMRGKAARLEAGSVEFATAVSRIADLELTLPAVPQAPRVFCDDITPERLGSLMADNRERMAILADEGGFFENLAGRYSRGIPNLDLVLKSHSGVPVRVDRGNRDAVTLNNPALTCGFTVQPDVLHGLAAKPGFRGLGLIARFIYFIATSRLGYRTGAGPSVAQSIVTAYEAIILRLLNLAVDNEPLVISLSKDAFDEWSEYSAAVEKDMRPGGRFEHITDWAGKLPGAAARIAGLLHCAEHAFDADLSAAPLALATMTRALDFATICEEHAFAAFGLMGADAAVKGAARLWKWIERQHKAEFTFRDAFNALRRSADFARADDLEPAFGVLVERCYIAPKPTAPRAGRPSRVYLVNPALLKESV